MTATATVRRDRAGLARGGALNLVGAVGSAALNLTLTVVVTRSLTGTDAGTFFAVTSVFLLAVGLARLGSGTSLVYWTSRLGRTGGQPALRAALRIALTPVAALSFACAIGVWWYAEPIALVLVGQEAGHADAAAGAVRAVALFLPFASLLEGVLATTRGQGTMRPTVSVERLGRPAVQLVLVAVTAGLGLGAVALAWAAPYLPALLLGSGWLTRRLRHAPPAGTSREIPPDLAGRYWRYTLPVAASGLVQVVLQRLDVILVAALLDPASAALYVAASRLLVLGSFGVQAVSMALQPQLARHFAGHRTVEVGALYRTSTSWLVLLTWPIHLLGVVHGPTLLRVFGDGYERGYPVMVLLACAAMFATACGAVDDVLSMAGRTGLIMGNVVVALVANVALNLMLIPRFGIEGAAVAWAASMFLNNALPSLQVWRGLGIRPFGSSVGVAIGTSVLAWGVVGAATVWLLGPGVPALVAGVGLSCVVHLVCVWALRRQLAVDDLVAALRSSKKGLS